MIKTPWYPANVDPVKVGRYEMINESTGQIFPVFFNGARWFHDREMPPGVGPIALVRIWPWRGATEPIAIVGYPRPKKAWEIELENVQ